MTVNANRKSLLAQVDKRWLGAGLAAAGAAVANNAKAAIVYHEPPPTGINVPSTFAGVYVNLDDQGAGGNTTPGWDINPYGVTYLRLYSDTTGSGWIGATATTFNNLAPGTAVCPTDTFRTAISNPDPGFPLNLGSNNNYVGIRFVDNGGTTRYGWMQLQIGATAGAQPRNLLRWAYENDPAACIAVGAAPEPGSLALLAAGALGLIARRRKTA